MEQKFTHQEVRLLGMTHKMMLEGKTKEDIFEAIKKPIDFTEKLMEICECADKELDRRIQEQKDEEC